MNILPAVTELPSEPLTRTHEPKVGDYATYRDCARWDFGFTCALCFLHESDLVEGGAEGWAVIWLEHVELKSEERHLRDVYTNLLLSCRFCNMSRGARLRMATTGARLLDPTKDCWSQHFELQNFALRERSAADADAVYTRKLYELDAQRKTKLREARDQRIKEFLRSEAAMMRLVPRLMMAASTETDPDQRRLFIEVAQEIERKYDSELKNAERYRAEPSDAPDCCQCVQTRALPEWLSRQLIPVKDVPGADETRPEAEAPAPLHARPLTASPSVSTSETAVIYDRLR